MRRRRVGGGVEMEGVEMEEGRAHLGVPPRVPDAISNQGPITSNEGASRANGAWL